MVRHIHVGRQRPHGLQRFLDGLLEADKGRPTKQRHTSKRIFERLRDEYGYGDGLTIVKDYVLGQRQRQREVFVPLRHDPGHAQADFGEALALMRPDQAAEGNSVPPSPLPAIPTPLPAG